MSWITPATLMNAQQRRGRDARLVDMRSLVFDEEFEHATARDAGRHVRRTGQPHERLNHIR
jgi:hypothetical protein